MSNRFIKPPAVCASSFTQLIYWGHGNQINVCRNIYPSHITLIQPWDVGGSAAVNREIIANPLQIYRKFQSESNKYPLLGKFLNFWKTILHLAKRLKPPVKQNTSIWIEVQIYFFLNSVARVPLGCSHLLV